MIVQHGQKHIIHESAQTAPWRRKNENHTCRFSFDRPTRMRKPVRIFVLKPVLPRSRQKKVTRRSSTVLPPGKHHEHRHSSVRECNLHMKQGQHQNAKQPKVHTSWRSSSKSERLLSYKCLDHHNNHKVLCSIRSQTSRHCRLAESVRFCQEREREMMRE